MLFNHQKEIIDQDPEKTGLFMGTGSGKTRTALSMARGKTLVIAPKTQVEDANWEREMINMNVGNLKLTVISKETFRRDWATLPPYDTVIVDEAHTCLGVTPNMVWRKGKQIPKTSQLFSALEDYLKRYPPKRLYLCTATIVRSPMTVWGAGKLLGKTWDYREFRSVFYFPLPMPGRDVWSPRIDSEAKDRLAKAVRSLGYTGRLEDYFDVPEQTFKNEYVELTAGQKAIIKTLPLEHPEPIVLLGKKLQVENGIIVGNEFEDTKYLPNEKLEKIIDYSYEFPRMIVFAKYIAQINQIAEAVRKVGKVPFTMTGDTPLRGELLKEISKLKEYVFIVSAQISAGWELPECPVMIFASRTYSFVDYQQALGRIQRVNNIKKNLYINLIVRGGIDEAVHKCLEQKQDFDERIYLKV